MASFRHGKDTRVILANPTADTIYDLSQFFNDVSISKTIETPETTTFSNGGIKTYIPGIKDSNLSLSGYYDGTASGVDAILTEAISNDADDAVLAFPTGGNIPNDICYMARAVEGKYDLKSPIGGVVAVDTEFAADGGVWRGRGQAMTITASGNTVALDNGTATSRGGLLVIGVSALSGVLSLTFQQSDDGTTYTDITTPLVSVGTQVLTTGDLPQPLKRYTRLYYTLTGSSPSAKIFYGFARY